MSNRVSLRGVQCAKKALPLAIAMAVSSTTVVAQETSNSTRIEEMTVTATKRAEDVQDISISVTAIDQESLRLGGVDDLSRLDGLVPGMQFGASGEEARLAIRGTRTNNVGTEAEQVVGIFEDGVYVPTSTQAIGSYVDLARVEVLRGPQGTLYGRNTFGGTINIVTNEPDFEEESGYFHVLAGTYDRVKTEGVLNLPLSDTLAVRVAAMTDKHDGYIKNTYLRGTSDDLNDQDLAYYRLTAKWAPNDTFDATLRYVSSEKDTNGSAIWGYQQIGAYVDGEYIKGHQYAPADASNNFDDGPWEVRRDIKSIALNETDAYTLTANWDFGPVTVKYVGNYTEFYGEQGYDSDYSDGTATEWTGNQFYGNYNDQETQSHELQVTSNGDGRIHWMAGYYQYDQEASWQFTEIAPNGRISIPHWDDIGEYESSSIGIFGNATVDVTDDIRVHAGLRWSEDDKGKRDPLDWSVWPPQPIPGAGQDDTWEETLWKVGYEQDLNEDQMAYFTASTGYRAGGFNFIADGVPPVYDPETVTAYELGLKNSLYDGSMTLNLALYYNLYRDMQAQSFIALGNGGVSEYTENGGELDAYGLEAELNWNVTDKFNVTASAALAEAEFGDYEISKLQGLGDFGGRQDEDNPDEPLLNLDGLEPALAPTLTLGLQLSYDMDLEGGSTLTPYFQTYYSDEYYGHDVNLEGNKQDSYTRSDIRLIWTSASENMEVQAYVLNIEEEEILLRGLPFNPSGFPGGVSIQAQYGNPRTAGVSMTYHF